MSKVVKTSRRSRELLAAGIDVAKDADSRKRKVLREGRLTKEVRADEAVGDDEELDATPDVSAPSTDWRSELLEQPAHPRAEQLARPVGGLVHVGHGVHRRRR